MCFQRFIQEIKITKLHSSYPYLVPYWYIMNNHPPPLESINWCLLQPLGQPSVCLLGQWGHHHLPEGHVRGVECGGAAGGEHQHRCRPSHQDDGSGRQALVRHPEHCEGPQHCNPASGGEWTVVSVIHHGLVMHWTCNHQSILPLNKPGAQVTDPDLWLQPHITPPGGRTQPPTETEIRSLITKIKTLVIVGTYTKCP